MKRVVVDHYGGPEVLRVVEEEDSATGPWRGARQSSRGRRVVHRCHAPRRLVSRRAEAPVHARLRARRRRRGARSRMLTPSRGRPYRHADGVGRGRGASLCSGGERGRGSRGSRPGRGHEPRLHAHDRLPAASSHRQGEEWGDGARARGGRQGGHGGPRARGGRWASHVRDLLRSRFRRRRAARRRGDRLPQRGLPGACARADRRRRCGRGARRVRRRAVDSLLPRAATRRKTCCVRPLRHGRARAKELAWVDQVVRDDRDRLALGPALAHAGGCWSTGSRSCAKATKCFP